LQRTAAYCSILQHTATHCNTLQHTATHCNTLQHIVCNTLQHSATLCVQCSNSHPCRDTAADCTTLQHTATHCNTLQHTTTHYTTLYRTAPHCNMLTRAENCPAKAVRRASHQLLSCTQCSVWQCVVMWCSVVQCSAVCCSVPDVLQGKEWRISVHPYFGVLSLPMIHVRLSSIRMQYAAVCCSVLRWLQCVAAPYVVLQCIAVCCEGPRASLRHYFAGQL